MGKLIVIEGTDGSGKSTQFRLLTDRLTSDNIAFQKLVFPQYSEPSSALIRMYLGGEFGTHPSDVNAYAASSFYAVDRYASYKKVWGQWYENGGLVLSDRYTTSNAVHQLSKIENDAEKDAFLAWLFDFEYRLLGLPTPDCVIYLEMPTDITLELLKKRCDETGAQRDIHENDRDHLFKSHAAALYACRKYGWKHIVCGENGIPFSPQNIHEKVYAAICDALPRESVCRT